VAVMRDDDRVRMHGREHLRPGLRRVRAADLQGVEIAQRQRQRALRPDGRQAARREQFAGVLERPDLVRVVLPVAGVDAVFGGGGGKPCISLDGSRGRAGGGMSMAVSLSFFRTRRAT
jgi:hypothetical protein